MTFQWDVFMFITAHTDEPNVIMMILENILYIYGKKMSKYEIL